MALWQTSSLQQHASEPGTSMFPCCCPLTETLMSERITTNNKQPTRPVPAVMGSSIAFSVVDSAIPLSAFPHPPSFKYF